MTRRALFLLLGLLAVATSAPAQLRAPKTPAPEAGVEAPKVVGVERPWQTGFIGLTVEGTSFVLRFYDVDRQPVTPPAARAAVRWDPIGRAGTERTILNPDDEVLRSPGVVRPPLLFTAYATLLDQEGESLGTVSFDLRELKSP